MGWNGGLCRSELRTGSSEVLGILVSYTDEASIVYLMQDEIGD